MSSIIILATMLEAKSAIEKFGFIEKIDNPYLMFSNSTKTLVICGIGLENAKKCTEYLCENFDFDEVLNVGACGALSDKYNFADVLEINSFVDEFAKEKLGVSPILMSSSRAIKDNDERACFSKIADVVDMEAIAIRQVALENSKKFKAVKYLSDFSENCDIVENIRKMRDCLNYREDIWI